MISDSGMYNPDENDRSGQNVWAWIKPYVEEMIQLRLQAELQPIRERLARLERPDRMPESGFDQSGTLQEILLGVKRLLELAEKGASVQQSSVFSAGRIEENEESGIRMQPRYIEKTGEPVPADQIIKKTPRFFYLKTMSIEGDISIRNTRLPREEACFELETTDGRTATLIPLVEQSGFLIMQLQYLLQPAFEIVRQTSGNKINICEPARYKLEDDRWVLLRKGLLEIIEE